MTKLECEIFQQDGDPVNTAELSKTSISWFGQVATLI